MSITVPAAVKAIEPTRMQLVAERVPAGHKTFDYIFDTDLAALLAEYEVRTLTSEITDPAFFGAAVVRGGRITLLLSPNLGAFEADFFPRYLICQALGMDLSPLPTPFEVEVNPLLPGVPA
ncbi:hypothetical protein [Streptomyces goshikiensis]|uniref:hypothetical protein n=1 Tax=Streptomyces goshikiensis TaxID=1942 RepID=UPI00365C0CA7